VTTPGIIDQIHELNLEGRWISAKSKAENMGISRERFGLIIHEDLDMQSLREKGQLMPELGSKCQRCQFCEQHLEFLWRDPNVFLSQLATMEETWLCHYDPETKKKSMEWWHSCSPQPK
jgi:hypothetical protein